MHYLAPFRWKKPVFVAVSMAGLFWVFGIQVAAVVLAFATVLIGICFLPIPWIGRAAALRRRRRRPGLRAARAASHHHPRQRLAYRGINVHVPDDNLSL